jgi:hypothetical protein
VPMSVTSLSLLVALHRENLNESDTRRTSATNMNREGQDLQYVDHIQLQ